MKHIASIIICLFSALVCYSQSNSPILNESITLTTETGELFGTLTTPHASQDKSILLFISGSGPTDRDGNNPTMTNNSIKLLAESLCLEGFSSLRFDKRGIAQSTPAASKEEDLRFDTYINDVEMWIKYLRSKKGYEDITIIGHSEGSLIGMIAAQRTHVNRFISLAGASEPANIIIRAQLEAQSKELLQMALPTIETLERGEQTKEIPSLFYSLFRPSVQPYLISWFKYNPQIEIAKLNIPILILQGDKDLQIQPEDAQKLSQANPQSQLYILNDVNHLFKTITGDDKDNIASYNNPNLAIEPRVIEIISHFLKAK